MSTGDFYGAAHYCMAEVEAFVRKHGLLGAVRADHICYKCGSKASFESRREWLEGESEYLHQATISNRRIAYLKFKKPVRSLLGDIFFLELSDQKPDGTQSDSFDHVELYPTIGTYDELVAKLEKAGEQVIKVERPHHTTHDIKLPSGFLVRLCKEPLIDKIKREEMQ